LFVTPTTPNGVSNMTPAQVAKLTAKNIAAMTLDNQKAFTATQLPWVSASAWSGFKVEAIAAMDAGKVGALGANFASGASAIQLAFVSVTDFDKLNSLSVISKLKGSQLVKLSSAQIGKLTDAQIGSLSTDALNGLNLGDFTAAQIGKISEKALSKLNPFNFSQLNTNASGLTDTQIKELKMPQVDRVISKLSTPQIRMISDAVIGQLSASKFASLVADPSFPTASTEYLMGKLIDLGKFTAQHVAALTDPLVEHLSSAQLNKLSPAAWQGFTNNNIDGLKETQLAGLDAKFASAVTQNLVQKLSSAQWSYVSPTAIAALDDKKLALLSTDKVQAMKGPQLDAITQAGWKGLADKICFLTATQVGNLGENFAKGAKVEDLTPAALAALKPATVGAIDFTKLALLLTPQVQAMTSLQLPEISQVNWKGLNARIGDLTATQVVNLGENFAKGAKVEALTPAALAALKPATVGAIDFTKLALLSTPQVQAMTSWQLAEISQANWKGLDAKIGDLKAEQVVNLGENFAKGAKVEALTTAALTELKPATVAFLTAAQITAFSDSQVDALRDEQLAKVNQAAWLGFSNRDIKAISPFKIAFLGADFGNGISPSQVGSLTTEQTKKLSDSTLAVFDADKVSALGLTNQKALSPGQLNQLIPAAWAGFGADNISGLVANISATKLDQVISYFDCDQIAGMTRAQRDALTGTQLGLVSVSGWAGFNGVNEIKDVAIAHPTSLGANFAKGTTAAQFKEITNISQLSTAVTGALSQSHIKALSKEQVAGFTDEQLTSLSPDAASGLEREDIALLTKPQVAKISPDSISSIPPAALDGLTATSSVSITYRVTWWSTLTGLTDTQINKLTEAQVAVVADRLDNDQFPHINVAAISSIPYAAFTNRWNLDLQTFGSKQIGAMTAAQFGQMSFDQKHCLFGEQLGDINSAAWAGLTDVISSFDAGDGEKIKSLRASFAIGTTPAQFASLTDTRWATVHPEVMGAASKDQIAELSDNEQAQLTVEQLKAMTPSAWEGLTNVTVKSWTPDEIKGLGQDIVTKSTPDQFAALTSAQIRALGKDAGEVLGSAKMAKLIPAQVKELSADLLNPLSAEAWTGMSYAAGGINLWDNDKVTAVGASMAAKASPAQFAALTPAQIPALGKDAGEVLDSAKMAALSPAQVKALSAELLNALSCKAWEGITPDVGGINLWDNAKVTAAGASMAAEASPLQFKALTPAQIPALSKEAAAAIDSAQMAALSAAQVKAFTPEQVASLSADGISGLTADNVTQMTEAQIQAITLPALKGMTPAALGNLNATQVGYLTDLQLASLSADQANALITDLSKDQIKSISDIALPGISAENIALIDDDKVEGFTTNQIKKLTVEQTQAFTFISATNTTSNQMGKFTPDEIKGFTRAQQSYFSVGQINALGSNVQYLV